MKITSIVFLFCLFGLLSFTVSAQQNCTYTINPTSLKVPYTGGNYTVNVVTQSGCVWTVENNSSSSFRPIALTFTSPTSGTGNGQVSFTVAQNAAFTQNRDGQLSINGIPFYIGQEGYCSPPGTNPKSVEMPREGGQGSFVYSSTFPGANGCTIKIQSNNSWIAAGGGGSEMGTAAYTVESNSAAARIGTISATFYGLLGFPQDTSSFTVYQAGEPTCTYSLSPSSVQLSSIGGGASFAVTTQTGCTWTATSNADWITTSSSGNGSGTVNYSVQQNNGSARSGTITVAGQTVSINQSAACSYALTPPGIIIGPGSLNASFQITTSEGCAWNAQSSSDWITITSGIGNGTGTVNYTVQTNTGASRTGTITAGGQTFTVLQSGAPPVELIRGSGRVMSADNKPVRGALVTFTNQATGEMLTTVTNHFGYFHLTVQRSQQYGVAITHKRYKFTGARGVAYNSGALIVIFAADPEQ